MQSRVAYKVIATALNFLMSVTLGVLVPNAIGPLAYGEFSYIVSTYAFLFQLFMFTSTTAYIYFLSQEKYKREEINSFYFLFLLLVSSIVIVIGVISINSRVGVEYLWNGLTDTYILYLGLLFAILTVLQQVLIFYSDATAQTVESEKIKLLSRFVIVVTIIVFIFQNYLALENFLILSILNFVLFFVLSLKYVSFKMKVISKEILRDILNDFYIYLKPLFMFTVIASTYSYFGKYVLQSSSGSIEQGYYNFALQLALIPVTFLSSLMAIYMSEMTKNFQKNNIDGAKTIFLNNIFKIYAIHAFISFFMLVNAQDIILLIVGKEYLGSVAPLQTLALFSLMHTFGMLSGNLFFSSGRNKEYNIINSVVMLLGIVYIGVVYFYYTLNATHLALIMTFFYFLRVIIQLYINLNYLEIKKLPFVFELLILSFIIITTFVIIESLGYDIFINFLLAVIILFIMNFLFKDYLTLKALKGISK